MEIKLYIRDLKCSKDKGNYIISKERKKRNKQQLQHYIHTHTKLSGFLLRNTESVCQINIKKRQKRKKTTRKKRNKKEKFIILRKPGKL